MVRLITSTTPDTSEQNVTVSLENYRGVCWNRYRPVVKELQAEDNKVMVHVVYQVGKGK